MEGTGVELSGLQGHRRDWSGMKGTGVDLSGLEWNRLDWRGLDGTGRDWNKGDFYIPATSRFI